MLWSNPTILYDTTLNYRVENNISWSHYWKLKNDPNMATMRLNHQVCLASVPPNIVEPSILWQHLFLDPLLKDMQAGWHLCLLPRRMIVIIKDGLYVCERLVSSEKEELIESSKTYLYRFGYELDVPLEIHDLRQNSETIKISPHYKGFILYPNQPWHRQTTETVLAFLQLFTPYKTIVLSTTLLSLSFSSLYYSYQNHVHDFDRINILRSWPKIQHNRIRFEKLLKLIGLLDEAKAPKSLIENVFTDDNKIIIQCSSTFSADKNLENMKIFLKKYYPYLVNVKTGKNKNLELILS